MDTDTATSGRGAAPRWTPEAEAEVAKAPFFIRPVARRAVVKAAEAEGVAVIDVDFVNRVRAAREARRSGRA
jgi:hypothetical protein